ncbi:MAG: heavy metal translocating P-type ATPase [Natronomonas sp.]
MTDDECTLCGLPTPDPPVVNADVEGEFCCRGCLEIQRQLGDRANEILEEADDASESPVDADALPEGYEQSFLGVDGMHCSTCEVFVESLADGVEGVESVEASYATELARVVYDPEIVDPGSLPSDLSGYGYEAYPTDDRPEEDDDLVVRFLIGGGLFGMMTMLWYVLFLYPTYFGFDPVVEFGTYDFAYVAGNIWVFASIVLFYTGFPLLRGAYVSLRAGQPNTDLLVSLAASGAYTYSTIAMALGRTDLYFDVTVAIVLVVTAGTYYESRIKRRAAGLLSELSELRVETATRHGDGESIPLSEIDPGEELLVRPGDRVPVDGSVVEGSAAVDEALVTGESLPRQKRPGDAVRGGTVVTDAPLVVRAGEEASSTLDRLIELLWRIQSTSSGAQRLADRLSTIFVPIVLVAAAVAAGASLWMGTSPTDAMLHGLTVLIVACPCALGLATPLAVATGIRTAAARGVVISTPALFETAADVDSVVFDKTGTITDGEMRLLHVDTVDDESEERLLESAAALERFSAHPVADAIQDAVPEAPAATDVETYDRGVRGMVDESDVLVGHPQLFEAIEWTVPRSVLKQVRAIRADGAIPVVIGREGRARGIVAIGDRTRSEWRAVAASFDSQVDVIVLTGDEGAAADRFRSDPDVDRVFEGVIPEAKAETIRRLSAGDTVAMIGDGTNDAPALAAADIGIALAGGTKLATDAADAIIVDDDLGSIPVAFDVATATRGRIRSNLAWAFMYNVIAIPIAVAGLLNPLFAAVAMASSSLIVVLNSARPLVSDDHTSDTTPVRESPEAGTGRDYVSGDPTGSHVR